MHEWFSNLTVSSCSCFASSVPFVGGAVRHRVILDLVDSSSFSMGSEQDGILSSNNVSAGGLVWVRRPNGSWWPGRVVGRDELPTKCVLPPRSGTPIKLLGREDGSMDWYNLAKSTRVKAFRCGEFDECIQKAMAFAIRSKKSSTSTGKYIRREDAILHALEIEKAYFLTGKQNGSGVKDPFRTMGYDFPMKSRKVYGLDKQLGHVARKLDVLEENSAQEVSQSLVSYEQTNDLISPDIKQSEKKRRKTPNDSEDNEGIKRMRDLQEIGLGVVSNRKPNVHASTGWFTELGLPDNASLSKSDIYDGFSSLSSIKSSKDSFSSLKRKRSHVAQSHENVRRKDRRLALSKVCEGTKVIVPSYCHWDGAFGGRPSLQGASPNKLNELLSNSRRTDISCDITISPHCSGTSSEELLNACENTREIDDANFDSEVKDSELASMLEFIDNDCSDGLIDIPLIMADNIREDFSIMFEHFPTRDLHPDVAEKQHNGCRQDELESHFTEGLGESSFTGSEGRFKNIKGETEKRSLERHLNHKKNLNNSRFSKNTNSENFMNGAVPDSSLKGKIQEERYFAGCKIDGSCFGESVTSNSHGGQLVKDESVSEVHDVPPNQSSDLHLSDEHGHSLSELVKIQPAHARDQDRSSKRHVPISALPIQRLFPHGQVSLSTSSKYQVSKQLKFTGVGSCLYDVEVTVQSSYRGPHVPLISLMSKSNSKEIVGHPVPIEVVEDGLVDTLLTTRHIDQSLKNGGNSIGKLLPKRKSAQMYLNVVGINCEVTNVTSLKRKYSINRKPRLSPRKIRRLSSINVDQKEKGEERKPVVEKMVGPAVACVPLRLVFSRITEALSSSTRLTSNS
ncbi:unnamed protein product [Musa hybrid cultivar]